MAERIKKFGTLMKQAFKEWNEPDPFSNSIVISYYTIFSLPGLLVIIINIAGYFLGADAVRSQLSGQISGVVGADTAKAVEGMIASASVSGGMTLATVLAVATLIFGATGVFYQLRQIMNKLWKVHPDPGRKIMKVVKDRATAFGLILMVGFLLLVSLVLSAAVASISKWIGTNIDESLIILFTIVDWVVSIGVISLLFAAIFKFVPDIRIRWKDVWPGAILTAVLFVVAKFLLGIYFAKTNPGSTYGAAGSVVLIMLWVTYSSLILLFGAQFTRVYTLREGYGVRPKSGTIGDTPRDRNPERETRGAQPRYRPSSEGPSQGASAWIDNPRSKPGDAETYHYEDPR
ncbi:MAG TPA: YihY/virulence factor BrkB family protein [Chryseosolibacter sp.]|nr:YihY/virulence factor BrkB family protein [Chryseosolibacter sp.]